MLSLMQELSHIIRARRYKKGGIEFEVNEYKGLNETLLNLVKLAKIFHSLYINCFSNKKKTLAIIMNFHLITTINKFVFKYTCKHLRNRIQQLKI